MRKGFTLIEMLIGLLFIPAVVLLSLSILSLMNKENINSMDQSQVFELQMRQFLIHSADLYVQDGILNGTYNDQAFEVLYDRKRLIKRPGYQILLEDLESVIFKGRCMNLVTKDREFCIEI